MTIANTAIAAVEPVSNSDAFILATREDVMRQSFELGAAEGRGAQSRAAFGMMLVRAAASKAPLVADTDEDKRAVYDAYEAGRLSGRTVAAMQNGTETDDTTDETDPVKAARNRSAQVSKLGAFISAGKTAADDKCNPEAVLMRCMELCKRPDVKSWGVRVYDAMVATCRAMVKANRTLSDKEILDAFRPKEKQPKGLVERLKAARDTLVTIRDGKESKFDGHDCSQLRDAIAKVENSILAAETILNLQSLKARGMRLTTETDAE